MEVQARKAIEAAVSSILPGGRVVEVDELRGGVSALVCRVEVETAEGGSRRLVFRQHRFERFKAHDRRVAATEFAVLRALHDRGFPVPAPLHLDDSGRWTGPFFLMELVEGSTEVAEADLPSALEQMAGLLARLHALDPVELGVPGLGRFEDPVPELSSVLPPGDLGEAVRSAIAAGEVRAAPNHRVIIHGDYWPGNVLWRDGRLAAVIDWEDCAISDPLADLACARVELLCRYGADAMDAFTSRYLRGAAGGSGVLRLDALALWEVFVSAAALSSMAEWGLDPEEERQRRRTTERFFTRAAGDLLGSRPQGP